LQALWCWRLQQGEKCSIAEFTDQFVELNSAESAQPDPAAAKVYADLQGIQDDLSKTLRGVFGRHRQFVLK
jgi:xylulokinase